MAKKKRKTTTKRKKKNSEMMTIINTVIVLSLVVFIFLSNMRLCGIVGLFIRTILITLFGTFAYLFPVLLLLCLFIYFRFDNKSSRIFTALIFYISITALVSLLIKSLDFIDNEGLPLLLQAETNADTVFSFNEELFRSGSIASIINYFLLITIDFTGAIIFHIVFTTISFLISFGLGAGKGVIGLILSIVFFIPNAIKKMQLEMEEDKKIHRENEVLLNKSINEARIKRMKDKQALEEKEKQLMENLFDPNYENPENKNLVLNDGNDIKSKLVEKKFSNMKVFDKSHYNTSNIEITSKDIQDRFFKAESEKNKQFNEEFNPNSEKEELLKRMKSESINEIINKNKNLTPESFFYTDSFKNPIDNNNIVDDDFGEYEYDTNVESENVEQKDLSNVYDYDNKTLPEVVEETSSNSTIRKRIRRKYKFPPLSLLNRSFNNHSNKNNQELKDVSVTLENTLNLFGVKAKVVNVSIGPSVTRYELEPELGVRVKKFTELQDDLKLALAATDIRIEAPIPGKPYVGIEVPNKVKTSIFLGDILSSEEFKNSKSKLSVAIGRDIGGNNIICDLASMPHLLVAGSTGSGKSVCINSIIMSLIYKASPDDVKLIMVDPKVVELQVYNDIPHLIIPVVTDAKKASAALNWAVKEMMRRYHIIQENQLRDIDSYNELIAKKNEKILNDEEKLEKLPKIVIIVDEFADLMMVASKDVEESINRIAQLARACGIHLVIATQRPSVSVISGNIKNNVPGRIAFAVSSNVDSRTILDQTGAEKLLGKGDMLYNPPSAPKPYRVQGCFVSDEEIKKVVSFVKDPYMEFDSELENNILTSKSESEINNQTATSNIASDGHDDYFFEAGKLFIEKQKATKGLLQIKFNIGFNRAARIMEQLVEEGVISDEEVGSSTKPRDVLMTMEEFLQKFSK